MSFSAGKRPAVSGDRQRPRDVVGRRIPLTGKNSCAHRALARKRRFMKQADSHLSDRQLLLDIDGELSKHDERLARTHLAACWQCRTRRQELQGAITDFVRVYQRELDPKLPPIDGPRALLRARLSDLSAKAPQRRPGLFTVSRASIAITVCGVLLLGFILAHLAERRRSSPGIRD